MPHQPLERHKQLFLTSRTIPNDLKSHGNMAACFQESRQARAASAAASHLLELVLIAPAFRAAHSHFQPSGRRGRMLRLLAHKASATQGYVDHSTAPAVKTYPSDFRALVLDSSYRPIDVRHNPPPPPPPNSLPPSHGTVFSPPLSLACPPQLCNYGSAVGVWEGAATYRRLTCH